MKYDILIVGAGLFGATFAERMLAAGKRVLVLEKRDHVGGNAYTEELEGIQVHRYGAHIFHTNSREVWDYVNRFADWNRFTNSPLANYHGKLYSLPFNMLTFYQMWGCTKPQEAEEIIRRQREEADIEEPENLEEQAISLVGRELYEVLVKGYTEKQWGRSCRELPAFIIRRLPVRFTYDNNYFTARFQGIPTGGYTGMVEKMLAGAEIRTGVDYLENRDDWDGQAERVLFTGALDAFYGFCYGPLAYRSLRFETEILDCSNFQGNAVVNYTDRETPYTRIIEHKWFDPVDSEKTVITREYPTAWQPGQEPFYPINDAANTALAEKYLALAGKEQKIIFGGRYYDMDAVILRALALAEKEVRRGTAAPVDVADKVE